MIGVPHFFSVFFACLYQRYLSENIEQPSDVFWGIDEQAVKNNRPKNKKLKCLIEPQKDYFGRYLGECFINNESVSAYMVRNGLAFDYPKYSKKKYFKDQIYAKNNKLGLWSMEFDYPWIWRKNNR